LLEGRDILGNREITLQGSSIVVEGGIGFLNCCCMIGFGCLAREETELKKIAFLEGEIAV
jgi:hypothetical protein